MFFFFFFGKNPKSLKIHMFFLVEQVLQNLPFLVRERERERERSSDEHRSKSSGSHHRQQQPNQRLPSVRPRHQWSVFTFKIHPSLHFYGFFFFFFSVLPSVLLHLILNYRIYPCKRKDHRALSRPPWIPYSCAWWHHQWLQFHRFLKQQTPISCFFFYLYLFIKLRFSFSASFVGCWCGLWIWVSVKTSFFQL